MKRLAVWVLFVLALAVVVHIAVLLYIPRHVTADAVDTLFAKYGGSDTMRNVLIHATLPRAGADLLLGDSPNSLISFAVLDTSSTPVRLHCVVPPGGDYWSVALFAWNTDAFWVINDREAPAAVFDVVVVKKGSLYESLPGEPVVVSPTRRTVMIVRTNVADRQDAARVHALTEAQQQMFVAPIQGVIY
jgi:uncharacterized membrane protein